MENLRYYCRQRIMKPCQISNGNLAVHRLMFHIITQNANKIYDSLSNLEIHWYEAILCQKTITQIFLQHKGKVWM